ncbi:ArgE/DapE family deacylase [Dactylosporangium roseum]|uniref:Probable succinyl-diaminopimelate desuccinylase n=1 Tax=Dactylosporangium roseum TaxID=47989 RepID=A0ABY5ZEJ7_9ACTN|nr:ArgE/DapE family deacylase [Dactylosporangium roseum]UWZ38729.1 ArgE/DapE family deacylase [Dactylosporangium roseum]
MNALANHDPALSALHTARDEAVATLADLIRIPSVGGTAAESEIVHHIARRLQAEDVEIDLWRIPVAELSARPDFPGMEVHRDEAWGLVARLPGTDPAAPTLMFNGHLDVVPPGDPSTWSADPYSGRIADGHAHGRGACDMKGGFVSALSALLALHRSGARPAGDVLLAAVVGEEDGGLGTYATLDRGWRADACVITEPTALDVLAANGGALTFRLRVPGLAAHACARTSGVSAVEKFQLIFPVLRALEKFRNRDVDPMMRRWDVAYPLEIGTVRAGDWASTVPDLLVAEGRFGVALDEPVDEARVVFERTVAEACAADPWLKEHPVTVEWWGGQFASGRCPDGSDLVQRVIAAHAGTSAAEAAVVGAPYGSDLRLLTAAGIPTVQYGPGVGYGHCPDERVSLAQVHACAETLVRLALTDRHVAD